MQILKSKILLLLRKLGNGDRMFLNIELLLDFLYEAKKKEVV